jgi:hypothetical protein
MANKDRQKSIIITTMEDLQISPIDLVTLE